MSGSTGVMLGGGGGTESPSSLRATQTPRLTGDVVVPFAVTLSTADWVQRPPSGEDSGSVTFRSSLPETPGRPYSFASGSLTSAQRESTKPRTPWFSLIIVWKKPRVSQTLECLINSSRPYSG